MANSSACGWLVLALTVAFPLTMARAEPALPYDFGQKVVIDRKAKTLVGPSVQIDDQGHVALVRHPIGGKKRPLW